MANGYSSDLLILRLVEAGHGVKIRAALSAGPGAEMYLCVVVRLVECELACGPDGREAINAPAASALEAYQGAIVVGSLPFEA
jgi:hypothetical protein